MKTKPGIRVLLTFSTILILCLIFITSCVISGASDTTHNDTTDVVTTTQNPSTNPSDADNPTTKPCLHINQRFINMAGPDCTTNGYTGDCVCVDCSAMIRTGKIIPACHGDTVQVNIKLPTCTEDGYTGDFECMICKEILESGETIPADGHTTSLVNAQAQTCTTDGYSGDTICTVCNEIVSPGATIAAMGHTYTDWITSKEATGFETGTKYRTCSECNDKEVATIPKTDPYPIVEEGPGYKITITREWYKKAWVYAAHIEFTDYARFGTSCANGKYNNGYETTSHAASRLNAILTVNGCYSAPKLNYTVVRSGTIWNGADRNLCIPGVYSSHTGLFQSGWEGKQGTPGISGVKVQQLVDEGKITDTFCFGPPGLVNGELLGNKDTSRAQRTFMGTNGNAGDIWLCVSDGRYNDGESAGLTFYEGMEFLTTKGCTFGIHLDGGGSTTMVYRGHVLNAAAGKERAVVDFVYFK